MRRRPSTTTASVARAKLVMMIEAAFYSQLKQGKKKNSEGEEEDESESEGEADRE